MAAMVVYLVLLCICNLIYASKDTAPALPPQAVREKFVLHGEARSSLFSQCTAGAQTVEGSLYSITVSEGVEYVRFVPKEKKEFQWTLVDLSDKGTVQCALKAFGLGAYMFKFDGSCNVALNSSYDPKSEQSCDGSATEVVYFNSNMNYEAQKSPVGGTKGCYKDTPLGLAYDDDAQRLVSEVQLSLLDDCCPVRDERFHCLVVECVDSGMSRCEAEARCNARGLPLASKDLFYDMVAKLSPPADKGTKMEGISWLNLRKIDGEWLWMPEKEKLSYAFKEENDEHLCAKVSTAGPNPELYTARCESLDETSCALCYDKNSTLPRCALKG